MEPDRRRIIYIVVAVIVVFALGWSYFSSKKAKQSDTTTTTKPTVISNLTNLDPTDFDQAVKDEYALAVSKAAEISPDYKIAQIEVNVGEDLQVDSINTRYIFASPNDPANNWMVTVAATTQNYIRALIPKDDYAGNISPFDTAGWKYNYVTALQLAEKAGGLDWRDSNTLSGISLTLKTSDTNSILTWTVQYTRQDGSSKIIILDATSGKVIE
ncbi:hypothetical protein COT78_03075 [Candidatus Berkelbacteria bacterium CG10_big_fil_rev_8_21_14_0_10_43_13]|uniref:PepSY domain-containing protein n=1 Tax=Candidatus Berkelbacteria bacterium CG10_big_fil_rev_8_21_14_0_10_43_13 TaxID=1974514 RepID=A0A2H0W6A1_9BACT|nr:MAG: hypothetical protein COT78_03075 [Candidatus Berkelbacteria bacterium CG10_big_fil_rev_8_21_14_0_10_43_13]